MNIRRRELLLSVPIGLLAAAAPACTEDGNNPDGAQSRPSRGRDGHDRDGSRVDDTARWRMPTKDTPHERTWMCWPSSEAVWGEDLASAGAYCHDCSGNCRVRTCHDARSARGDRCSRRDPG